jgi:hypothetical protein
MEMSYELVVAAAGPHTIERVRGNTDWEIKPMGQEYLK